jgi:tetratricopeptide (TPR) repeat protein
MSKTVIKTDKTKSNAKEDKYSFLTRSFYPYIILALITFVVYFQVVSFGLIVFDDLQIIERAKTHSEENIMVASFKYDAYFKSTANSNFYRPVQNLTILLDAKFSQLGYTSFHVTNLLLHILVVVSLFTLITKLKINKLVALFISLFYAVHPLFAFNVAWIASRGDLLATLFSILATISFIKYLEERKTSLIVLNLLFMLFGMLSKEIASVLPVLFMSYFFFVYYGKNDKSEISSIPTNHKIIFIFGWLAVIAQYFMLKNMFLAEGQSLFVFGIPEFISNLRYFPEYLAKTFVPVNISGMSQYNDIRIMIGSVLIIACLIYAILNKDINSRKRIAFFSVWIILFLLPVITFKPVFISTGEYWEHRAYLPLIGLYMLIAEIISHYKFPNGKIVIAGLIITLILSITTIAVAKNFSGPFSYFDNVINQGNELPNAYFGRAIVFFEKKNSISSLNDLNRAIELKDDYYEAYFKRGIILSETNKVEKAIADFNKAARLKPNLPDAYFNLSICYYKLRDYNNSYLSMKRSMDIDPNQERGAQILLKLQELMNQK